MAMIATPDRIERTRGTRCCDPGAGAPIDATAARALTDDLAILAHPVRLQLLALLAAREGQVCVCDLEAAVPVKQPTVSHHLRLLREAGLIEVERDGLWAYYRVQHAALAALRERLAGGLALLG
jgi:ArsR family transcriptional regulator